MSKGKINTSLDDMKMDIRNRMNNQSLANIENQTRVILNIDGKQLANTIGSRMVNIIKDRGGVSYV